MKVIFLDIDNTLLSFDGYVKEGMINGFKEFGLRSYEPWMYDIFKEENDKLWCMIERKELTFDELIKVRWNIIFKRLGIDCDGPVFETYFRSRLNESAIPMDGAYEMLDALKGKYILATASNGPYQQQLHRLKLAGMDKFMDYVFISEKVGYSKPAKEFFDKALKEINADITNACYVRGHEEIRFADKRNGPVMPDDCVIVGDSLTSDIAGGRNAGMYTCYYIRNKKVSSEGIGGSCTDMGVDIDADIIVDDLRDVAGAIKMLEKLRK